MVYHSAAKVGDWGPWKEFQAGCIDATRNLAEAAVAAGVGRFLHISSTSAYGHPAEGGAPVDETAPMGQNVWVWDAYTRSKVESEKILWGLADVEGLAGYGDPAELALRRARPDDDRPARRPAPRRPRAPDRPRRQPAQRRLRRDRRRRRDPRRRRPRLGRRGVQHHQPGADHPARVLRPPGRRRGVPRVRRKVPYRVAYAVAFGFEAKGGSSARPGRPGSPATPPGSWAASCEYSTEKARTRLGWNPP